VLPTVTEVSRTSLLTGKVQAGGQATERSGFENHVALGKAPRLLHKDLLSGDRVGIDPRVKQVREEQSISFIVLKLKCNACHNELIFWTGSRAEERARKRAAKTIRNNLS
jgi:hypothetical protein